MIQECVEEDFDGILQMNDPTYHQAFQYDKIVTAMHLQACGGLECTIGRSRYTRVYDNPKAAFKSFKQTTGQPLPPAYMVSLKERKRLKDTRFLKLPFGAKDGEEGFDFLTDFPILDPGVPGLLDCAKKAVQEACRILGGDFAGKVGALKDVLLPIKVLNNKTYLSEYYDGIKNTLGLFYRKQKTFSCAEPFEFKSSILVIGFIDLHAYVIIKIDDTFMIIDAAEPHALAMVDANLDILFKGKNGFKKMMAFTKDDESAAPAAAAAQEQRQEQG